MSHHHYEDVIDNKATNDRIKKIEEEKNKLEEEKKSLIKAEEIKNIRAFKLSQDLEQLKTVRDKTEKSIIEKTKELYKYCTHEKTRDEHRYVEGGYLNKSENITTTYCALCGIQVDEKVKYGGYS